MLPKEFVDKPALYDDCCEPCSLKGGFMNLQD